MQKRTSLKIKNEMEIPDFDKHDYIGRREDEFDSFINSDIAADIALAKSNLSAMELPQKKCADFKSLNQDAWKSADFFDRHRETIYERFNGKWIAIANGEIILYKDTVTELRSKIKKMYPNISYSIIIEPIFKSSLED